MIQQPEMKKKTAGDDSSDQPSVLTVGDVGGGQWLKLEQWRRKRSRERSKVCSRERSREWRE